MNTTISSGNFFHHKQLSLGSDYVEQFSDIVHQLLAYDPKFSPTVITNHFVDGLKKDIRAVVMLHRPQDLDIASSLAFLQEEAMQDQVVKKSESVHYVKKNFTEAHKHNYTATTPKTTEDKKNVPARTKPSNDKLSAQKSYRRTKGLYFKCGEKMGTTT